MATIKRYQTAAGEQWEVRYRQPNGITSRKRGFTTKRDASAWASKVETTGGVFHVREDEPAPRVGAGLLRTP